MAGIHHDGLPTRKGIRQRLDLRWFAQGKRFVIAQCGSGVSSPGAEHEDGREGEVHGARVRVLCAVLLRVVTAGDRGE